MIYFRLAIRATIFGTKVTDITIIEKNSNIVNCTVFGFIVIIVSVTLLILHRFGFQFFLIMLIYFFPLGMFNFYSHLFNLTLTFAQFNYKILR